MLPEEEVSIQKECQQLRRDLEFCQSEIERLRAKLVLNDDEERDDNATGLGTSLAEDLQKGGI